MAAADESGLVLVTTATGQVGSATVLHLLEKKLRVRAATRHADGAEGKAAAARGAEVVQVDFSNPASVEAAVRGATAVVFISPFCDEHQDVTDAWLEAFETHKGALKHIVRISCLGASDPQTHVQKWHALDEVLTSATEVPTTVLRPTYYLQYLLMFAESIKAAGFKHVHCMGDARVSYVDARDVARCVGAVLAAPDKYAGQSLDLHGPVAVSMSDVCRLVSDAVGQQVEYLNMPFAQYRAGLGKFLTESMADHIVETIEAAAKEGSCFQVADKSVEEIVGAPAVEPDAFIREHAKLFQ